MSLLNTNLVAISNGNNNNNIIAASNGDSFIATISGNQGPFAGAKYFKGAALAPSRNLLPGLLVWKPPLALFLASKPRTTHAPVFGSNKALQQAGKLVSDEPASKFIVPSSARSNGGSPEHLENALTAQQADNSAYIEKQRADRKSVV